MSNHITFIIGSLSGGGSEGVCVNVANGLAARGWNVNLVCMNLNRKEHLDKISEKVNLTNLNISRFTLSFIPIMKYLKKNKIEHVVCFHYFFASQLVLQRFFLNNQFQIIARNNTCLLQDSKYYFRSYILNKLIFKIVKILYHRVDYSIAQCQEMKLDLVKNFNFDSSRVKVILNPVNNKIENSFKGDAYLKEEYILSVGRLSKEKRHDIAIKVFSNVKKRFPHLKLKIAGQGREESFLKKVAKKYNVSESVEFLGFQKDLITLYKKAKLTLMTSTYEGFPNALIESITLGTPVVSFDCPTGPSEIVRDGVNGFLVKKKDEKLLEKKIVETLHINWDIQKIHNTAFNHRHEKVINEYEKFFKQLVN